MIYTILTLIVLLLAVWFWQAHMRAKEIALIACQDFCRDENLQLLDETVALKKIKIKRHDGAMHILRTYQFDYCLKSDNREQGHVALLGHEIMQKPSILSTRHNAATIINFAAYKTQNNANHTLH